MPASSFYPGYGGVASIFDTEETNQDPDPNIDEPHTEDEEDWIYEQAEEMTALPRGQREKAMAIEVRLLSLAMLLDYSLHRDSPGRDWMLLLNPPHPQAQLSQGLMRIVTSTCHQGTMVALLPSLRYPLLRPQVSRFVTVSILSANGSNLNMTANTATLLEDVQTQSPSVWPTDTEIQLVPGTNRVILTRQGILLRTVIQDAFENVRASIFFENAFPDVVLALSFIRDGLLTAAGGGPATASIYMRLLNDKDYLMKIVPLVRTITHSRR